MVRSPLWFGFHNLFLRSAWEQHRGRSASGMTQSVVDSHSTQLHIKNLTK